MLLSGQFSFMCSTQSPRDGFLKTLLPPTAYVDVIFLVDGWDDDDDGGL